MRNTSQALHTVAALLTLAFASSGCVATSRYMRPSTVASPVRPGPGQAVVVFVRPSGYAGSMRATIMDGNGRFLGDSLPESQFAVALPAGHHVFVVWAENTEAMLADLAPGRTYFVEVSMKMGFMSARAHLFGITPRSPSWGSENWAERAVWLRETQRLVPDLVAGQTYLDSRAADRAERLRRATEALAEYPADERPARSLLPQDGV